MDRIPHVIVGKDLERHFDLLSGLSEFTAMFENETNDRAVAIVGAAFLDTMLEQLLVNYLVDDAKEVNALLSYDKSMGTYGSRTTAVYCLGRIGKVIRDDLRLVGKIRNRFAHDLKASFAQDPVMSWCKALRWHEISMLGKPPEGATPRDIFQVGVNQLICHLNGLVSLARMDRLTIPENT